MMEINGRPVTSDDIRSLGLYNYGHFTSMRVEEMRVRGLTLHMERLARDSNKLFGVEVDTEKIRQYVRRVARDLDGPAIIRVTLFDSAAMIDRPGSTKHPDILVSVRNAPTPTMPPLKVGSAHYQRELPTVKHVGLFGSLYHRRAAQLRGFDDALFVDEHSRISEGATWNIGFFDGSQVIWPKAEILPGVTLNLVKNIIAASGMTSVDTIVHIGNVSETWAAFATNASVGVRPIQSIDDVELLDDSPLIRNLQLQYAALASEAL